MSPHFFLAQTRVRPIPSAAPRAFRHRDYARPIRDATDDGTALVDTAIEPDLIERLTSLEDEIAGLNARKSDCYRRARHKGLKAKCLKHILALIRTRPDTAEREIELLRGYAAALGVTNAAALSTEAASAAPLGHDLDPLDALTDFMSDPDLDALASGNEP